MREIIYYLEYLLGVVEDTNQSQSMRYLLKDMRMM